MGTAFLPAIKAASEHIGEFIDRIRDGVDGGAIDVLTKGLEGVVDVVAEAFADPDDRAKMFMSFLDLLVAATKYAAAEMEDAIVDGISRAVGRSGKILRSPNKMAISVDPSVVERTSKGGLPWPSHSSPMSYGSGSGRCCRCPSHAGSVTPVASRSTTASASPASSSS